MRPYFPNGISDTRYKWLKYFCVTHSPGRVKRVSPGLLVTSLSSGYGSTLSCINISVFRRMSCLWAQRDLGHPFLYMGQNRPGVQPLVHSVQTFIKVETTAVSPAVNVIRFVVCDNVPDPEHKDHRVCVCVCWGWGPVFSSVADTAARWCTKPLLLQDSGGTCLSMRLAAPERTTWLRQTSTNIQKVLRADNRWINIQIWTVGWRDVFIYRISKRWKDKQNVTIVISDRWLVLLVWHCDKKTDSSQTLRERDRYHLFS